MLPNALQEQLTTTCSALEEALKRGQLGGFYHVFRSTELPYLAPALRGQTWELFRRCAAIVERLGEISPAVALAVENHYYVTSSIATFPTHGSPALSARCDRLMTAIADDRLLVANTNSKVHKNKLGEIGTLAREDGAGFRINGVAAYTSLATEGDVLVFMTQLERRGPCIFAIRPLQGNPRVDIGPYLFPSAMIDSDTRKITFHDLYLPEEDLIADETKCDMDALIGFEMAWHQSLIAALYLGAANRAIREVREFLGSTRGKDERPLAELDGMVVDVGRLTIDHRAACALVYRAGEVLSDVQELPRDASTLQRAVDLARAAKFIGTRVSETVVTGARRIIGARTFTGGHALERLSQEVMFASLGPEVSAVIERHFGRKVLNDSSFLDDPW